MLNTIFIRSYFLHKIIVLICLFVENICYKSSFFLYSKDLYKKLKKELPDIFNNNKPFYNPYFIKNCGKFGLKKVKKEQFDCKNKKYIIIQYNKDFYKNPYSHMMFGYNGYVFDNESFYVKKLDELDKKNFYYSFFIDI